MNHGKFAEMPVQKISITDFLLYAETMPVIDVRSPGEYVHAHLPGAYSLPLFTDEERKVVGTAYKQQGRQQAIKFGLDFFGPKMKSMVEEVEKMFEVRGTKYDVISEMPDLTKEKSTEALSALNPKLQTTNHKQQTSNSVLLHCWRGGMRSGAVAWLLDLYGFKVYILDGGYKAFRNWVLQQFETDHPLKIIGGYTGSGKTELLSELKKKGEAVIDLEALANHKGSAFGGIGKGAQPSTEMFENRLALQLWKTGGMCNVGESLMYEVRGTKYDIEGPEILQDSETPTSEIQHQTSNIKHQTSNIVHPTSNIQHRTIWLEDESQRIGNINIPNEFWKTMRSKPVVFLDIPFEERLEYITSNYGKCDKEKLVNAVMRIKKRLGGLEAKAAINFLLEDDVKESFRILLSYYDKLYKKGLHSRENQQSLITEIKSDKVEAAFNAQLVLKHNN